MRGWFLHKAALVFWIWPFSLSDALVVCVVLLIVMMVELFRYPFSARKILAILFLLMVIGVFRRLEVPRACSPRDSVAVIATDSEPGDVFLQGYSRIVACDNDARFRSKPFSITYQSIVYTFFERNVYERGIISFASNKTGSLLYSGMAFMELFPLERPCVFVHNEQFYMLPETPSLSYVLLYTAATFPTNWHVVRNLVFVQGPASSMLFRERDDLWYLALMLTDTQQTIYYSAISPEGPFVPVSLPTSPASHTAVCEAGSR
jgi:hypothetical protein